MNEHRLKAQTCRRCGSSNDAASGPYNENQNAPEHGDLDVCAYCGVVSMYAENGQRKPFIEDSAISILHDIGLDAQRQGSELVVSPPPGNPQHWK